jgi:acylphosphatase
MSALRKSEHERVVLTISGRVQGIGYRRSAQQKAEQLGLSGWVQNLDNGDVMMLAEGTPEQIDALELWTRNAGPRMARVDRVEVKRSRASGEFSGFVIR